MRKLAIVLLPLLILALVVGGCGGGGEETTPTATPAPTPTPTPTPTPELSEGPDSVLQETKNPVLSEALVRGCERTRPSGGFENIGLAVGETAVDFALEDVHGHTVSLAGLLSEKPVVMVFGSFI